MNKFKMSFEEAVHLRNYRKNHTRYEAMIVFGVSEPTITKVCKETDDSLIRSYGGSVDYSEVEIIDCFLDKVKIRYKSGVYRGLYSFIKLYYLINTDFSPSFAILTDESKQEFISDALKHSGYKEFNIARVGDKGLGSEYVAVCEDKRLYWPDLVKLIEAYKTILAKEEEESKVN